MKITKILTVTILSAFVTLALPSAGFAESGEIRIAKQYGIGYLPLIVMKKLKLYEKYAEQENLEKPIVTWYSLTGGANMNDALLSGSLDIAAGGVPSVLTLWSRTKEANTVKVVSIMSEMPLLLATNNPKIRTIKDFANDEKIALPAVGTSNQAVLLRMAAERESPELASRLKNLTVSMSHPDAMIALLNGSIAAHFSSPPFQYQELKDSNIHTILSSEDIIGPFTFTATWATEKFKKDNPKSYRAFLKAIYESIEYINQNKPHAAEIYQEEVKAKDSKEELLKMLDNPGVKFTEQPHSIMRYAAYLYEIGLIKVPLESLQDMFFEEVGKLGGS